LYFNIFNYKLKKSNINNRLPLIFLMFNLLFADKSRATYYGNKNKVDTNYINQIYNKLIDFYELPKEIKKKERKKPQKKENKEEANKTNETKKAEQNEEDKGEDYMDYLYTIINFNNREHRKKQNKVEYNKNSMKRSKIKKPIDIDGDEKIFSSYTNNDIDIIKLNDRLKYR